MDYKLIFDTIVENTAQYLTNNNIKAMVLGISGGIDSTVCAAICREVKRKTGIPLIGRSLRIKNKHDEYSASVLVGNAFCDDFKEIDLSNGYNNLYDAITINEGGVNKQTLIADGNIQARLRMIYLYNLAGINKGLVIDTDNLSEHYLGFFTINGDVGDLNPIGNLWKTEVYELAHYLSEVYNFNNDVEAFMAMEASIKLTPTDGLGISNSDLEQIGAKSYNDVDDILKTIITKEGNINIYSNKFKQLSEAYGFDVLSKIVDRHLKSQFKRVKLPIVVDYEKNK